MIYIFSVLLFPFLLLQKITPSLIPLRGLKKIADNTWEATDNDPQFVLGSSFIKVLSGWISIRVEIDSEKIITPKLYFDFGEGYSESRTAYLQQIEENLYQIDLMIPTSLRNIRFDPDDDPGTFSLLKFEIRVNSEILYTIHKYLAIVKHDQKNGNDPYRLFKKSYMRYKKHGFKGMLERLEKEYKLLYPYKMQRNTSKYTAYLNWIKENERNEHHIFNKDDLVLTPLISIIMTTYNTPIEYLTKAIDSVLKQSYPYWELCIADDASNDPNILHLLDEYMHNHKKVKVFFRNINGNISLASNSALTLAKGEYIALMDHDDMLAPNALLEIVKAVNSNPKAKLLYSDEDKIDEKDRRYDPHFKSGWNPDMFYSQNYISHLSVIKKSLLDVVGMFRTGYEGAQDYDLLLRIVALISPDEIVHIEKILYHWRAHTASSAYSSEMKSYTSEAGLKALTDHFVNIGENTIVKMGVLPNTYKVSYLYHKEPPVSLIIPTRDGYDILYKCIQSILEKTTYKNYEIVIIDNQSTDFRTLEYFDHLIDSHQNIRILKYDKAFNYSAINNFAVENVTSDIIGLINNDIEVITGTWLTHMVQHAIRPQIGAVGAKLYYDNDTIQHAGIILGIGGVAGHSHKHCKKNAHGYFSRLRIIQNYSAVTGACLVLRKTLFEEVHGLEEDHLKIAFNDVDLCLKLQEKGYRNIWTPYAELYHHESISRGKDNTNMQKERFNKEVLYMKEKWASVLGKDNYYNTNLTQKFENFSIRRH